MNIYGNQGKVDLAYQTSHEGLKLAEESGDTFSKAEAYTSCGYSSLLKANLASIAILNDSNLRKLREQAHHDGLTTLLNKRYFLKEKLGLAINDAERENRPLGVFIFDIDHFKHFNDTNGHVAGDQVLKEVAEVLRENLRADDIACRYGGEEFVVAMPGADSLEAMRVAERIRIAIESHPFAARESQPGGRVTISGGVSVFPSNGTNGNDLIHRADQAL